MVWVDRLGEVFRSLEQLSFPFSLLGARNLVFIFLAAARMRFGNVASKLLSLHECLVTHLALVAGLDNFTYHGLGLACRYLTFFVRQIFLGELVLFYGLTLSLDGQLRFDLWLLGAFLSIGRFNTIGECGLLPENMF